jgi:hypothetical protein
MNRRLLSVCAALAFTLLIGQITDRTTGQPLRNVDVTLQSGHRMLHAATGRDGRFTLSGVTPGTHTLRYSSADVPPQSIIVRVHGARQSVTIAACSTTLDYSCESGGGS